MTYRSTRTVETLQCTASPEVFNLEEIALLA